MSYEKSLTAESGPDGGRGRLARHAGRKAYYDNLKFVLIALVVLGHYVDPFSGITPAWRSLFFFIYLFHMPLFVFVTGLFSKSLIDEQGRFYYGRVCAFLLLYLGLNTGIFLIEKFLDGRDVLWNPLVVSNASWYLLACCLWYLLLPLIRSMRPWLVLTLSVLLALGAGYIGYLGDFLSLARFVVFAPFFLLGYYMDSGRILGWLRKKGGVDRLIALLLLIAAVAFVFWAGPALSRYRGLLTGRNHYDVLGALAPFGAVFRLGQFVIATLMGLLVMVAIPTRKNILTPLGRNTLQLYVWHLLVLRLLGCISLVSLTAGWGKAFRPMLLLPALLALVVTLLFSLKPPFGLLIGQVVKRIRFRLGIQGAGILIPLGLALAVVFCAGLYGAAADISLLVKTPAAPPQSAVVSGAAVAAPQDGKAGETDGPDESGSAAASSGAISGGAAESSTAGIKPPDTAAPPSVPVDNRFELPVEGAMAVAAVDMKLREEADENASATSGLKAGDRFTIGGESGDWWYAETAEAAGWVARKNCLINLPDIIPSIVYDDTNAYASIFHTSGFALPGITGEKLYDAKIDNRRLGREQYVMPVLYGMALKVYAAQQSALAAGDTLVIYETFRPRDTQKKVNAALTKLAKKEEAVRKGMTTGGWSQSWFIAQSVSSHQRGGAMDVTLAQIVKTEKRQGAYAYTEVAICEEYRMPNAIHDLGVAAAAFSRPVSSKSETAWRSAKPSKGFTEGAARLQKYCTDAGLTPLASEWWHFNDWETLRTAPQSNIGAFRIHL